MAGISRQAAHYHLRRMVRAGELVPEGRGRAARYRRATRSFELCLGAGGIEEDRVWASACEKMHELRALAPNARDIAEHALIELVTNAQAHAGSAAARLRVELDSASLRISVEDDGIGAFESLRRALGLGTAHDALVALCRGRASRDTARFRGESLFLLRELADFFEIEANGLCLACDGRRGDEAVRTVPARSGSRVSVEIALDTERRERDVLSRVTIDHAFARTRASVRLVSSGVRFPSRAEAKRLLHGLERFSEVVIDFAGVECVGVAFADEVFRVWPAEHPGTRLVPANMQDGVEITVLHAQTPP